MERAVSHQTTRLGVGRHEAPGPVVCVMELASMLAGERFSDRPASVCPIIGSILRIYNDNVGDEQRDDLYRYAAEAVGTRGDFRSQLRRAAYALAWAEQQYAGLRFRRRPPRAPAADAGPDLIADYLFGSIKGRMRGRRSAEVHALVLRLVDELIALGAADPAPALVGEMAVGAAPAVAELQLV